ncbi:HAMP domain-containing sensor histidine kinase [Streptomyces sp. NPDC005897]|uniref:sensor histidine kinase n=1 Tax=Streptomyces sp. NPDC005897 TaxID=3157081 RepID=UPI0033F36BDA
MRSRVQATLLLFGVLVVAAFAVPLLLFTASDRTQQLVLARSSDLDRFATPMDHAAATGDTSAIIAEARRYTLLYGEPIVVVDARRTPVVETGGLRASSPAIARLLDSALRNQDAHPTGTLRPWSHDDRMFAEPAGTGTQVSGAVLIRASVHAAVDDIRVRWAAVLAGTALVAVACTLLARAATRWVVSPLRRLDRAVGELTAGLPSEHTLPRLAARPGTPPAGGPPELRQLASGFNRMARAVRAALEQQRRLVADTSHQMRNPMAALRLRVDALHTHLPPSADRTYQGVTTELDRLETLLDDMLTLATAEHRAGELAVTNGSDASCDASEVVLDRHRLWEPVARQAGARLTAHAPAPVFAVCTERELAQVADVLVDNAIKYAGRGAAIGLRCSAEGPYAVVTVTDDGPGLPPADLRHATTRFWRASRRPTPGKASPASVSPVAPTVPSGPEGDGPSGTGLGLAIVDELLTGRAGRLELAAARPRGLRARALVPRPGPGGEPR